MGLNKVQWLLASKLHCFTLSTSSSVDSSASAWSPNPTRPQEANSDSSTTSSEEGVELFEDVNIVDDSNMDIYDDVSDDEENQNEVPPEEEPNTNNELNRLVLYIF